MKFKNEFFKINRLLNKKNFFESKTGLTNNKIKQYGTLKEGLGRTVGSISSSFGFTGGVLAGVVTGGLIAAFALDDPNTTDKDAAMIVALGALMGAGLGTATGYFSGYASANLFLAAFPGLKNIQSSLILNKGIKPQFYLFLGTTILQGVVAILEQVDSEDTNQNRPRM